MKQIVLPLHVAAAAVRISLNPKCGPVVLIPHRQNWGYISAAPPAGTSTHVGR